MSRKKEKNKLISKNKSVSVIILIFIIVVIALFILFNYKKLGIVTWNKNISVDYNNYVDIEYSSESIIENYKNELLIYEKDTIYTVNKKGNITWQKKIVDLTDPVVVVNNNYFIIVDKYNGTYYLYKNKKNILEGRVDNEINQVVLDKKGNFIFEQSTKGYKSVISYFKSNGENDKNYYLMADMVTNLKLLENQKKILYVAVEREENNINTTLCSINLNTDKISIDELTKIENETIFTIENLYPYVIINTESGIYKYNINTSNLDIIKKIDIDNIIFSNITKNNNVFIKKNNSNETNNQQLLITNTLINYNQKINLEFEPTYFEMKDNIIALSSEKNIMLYNILGLELKKWNSTAIVSKIKLFNKGQSIAVVIANKLYILNL